MDTTDTSTPFADDALLERDVERWLTPGHPDRGSLIADPYPLFDRIRASNPVYKSAVGPWIVTRFDDVFAILRDLRWSRDVSHAHNAHLQQPAVGPDSQEVAPSMATSIFSTWMLYTDPPEHSRLRRLVSKAFAPKAILGWQPRIDEIIADLLADLRQRAEFDIRHDYANQLSATVMCEMIGMPTERFDEFVQWSGALITLQEPGAPSEATAAAERLLDDCIAFFDDLIRVKRTAPGDDIISLLLECERDERVSREEIIGMCMMLHVAGHETTANRITNVMFHLLADTAQHDLIRSDPSLSTNAIDEVLRFSSTGPLPRYALVDIEVAGTVIPRGDIVIPSQGAANRDPDRFPDPHRFDITRANARDHIAFGTGLHHCLGVNLARMESVSALTALISEPRRLEPTGAEVRWRDSLVVRGLDRLPVRWI
ncbi:MAG: cytochrome P450 [Ilumatobacteraceae bacterium]